MELLSPTAGTAASPESHTDKPRARVVVDQEIFGVNAHIRPIGKVSGSYVLGAFAPSHDLVEPRHGGVTWRADAALGERGPDGEQQDLGIQPQRHVVDVPHI